MTVDPNPEAFLLCQIESRICAIPLARVSETMRPLPIASLAGTPSFVLGLAVIRGTPTPVVDTGRLLGSTELHATRFVVVKTGARFVALAVSTVLGVRSLPQGTLVGIPPLLREASTEMITAIGFLDAELLLLLETARLVPESTWSAIEEAGAQP